VKAQEFIFIKTKIKRKLISKILKVVNVIRRIPKVLSMSSHSKDKMKVENLELRLMILEKQFVKITTFH
jgi:hypothetical protein